MKRAAVLLVLCLTTIIWLFLRSSSKPKAPSVKDSDKPTSDIAITLSTAAKSSQPIPLLGETILREYADPKLPPENDLTLISRLMDNFTLLVKTAADRPMSANEDWAAAFRGMNPAHERFLPDQSIALNAQGQLVDRWGSPLFFHALGEKRFELRSAGPDKKLWTADDLHRNANGSFRRGADLNPPSLVDDASRRGR